MKFIKSKCLQKAKGRKIGKYQITLEVTDNDILTLEDFATTYAPFQLWQDYKNEKITYDDFEKECEKLDYSDKYSKWLMKLFYTFCKLWKKYDD